MSSMKATLDFLLSLLIGETSCGLVQAKENRLYELAASRGRVCDSGEICVWAS